MTPPQDTGDSREEERGHREENTPPERKTQQREAQHSRKTPETPQRTADGSNGKNRSCRLFARRMNANGQM